MTIILQDDHLTAGAWADYDIIWQLSPTLAVLWSGRCQLDSSHYGKCFVYIAKIA